MHMLQCTVSTAGLRILNISTSFLGRLYYNTFWKRIGLHALTPEFTCNTARKHGSIPSLTSCEEIYKGENAQFVGGATGWSTPEKCKFVNNSARVLEIFDGRFITSLVCCQTAEDSRWYHMICISNEYRLPRFLIVNQCSISSLYCTQVMYPLFEESK